MGKTCYNEGKRIIVMEFTDGMKIEQKIWIPQTLGHKYEYRDFFVGDYIRWRDKYGNDFFRIIRSYAKRYGFNVLITNNENGVRMARLKETKLYAHQAV